jgi:hypothetical protein
MRKLIRDPLIHFLAIGAALFVFFYWRNDGTDPERIRISADQVRRLTQQARLARGGDELSDAELEAVVEPAVRDEVYYREALALGLDVDDDQVRARLIEKMRYLTEDLADPEPAAEAELEAFFAAAPERFAVPAAVSFEQVYFSPQQRGAALEADVAAALAALPDGADPAAFGDRTPLGVRFEEASADRLEVLFGADMTTALFAAEPGRWIGPFTSDFGRHLVRVSGRRAARQPSFAEVRDEVLAAFAEDRRRQRNEAAYRGIRDRYEIVVDWPDAEGAVPEPDP